jgi:hypothetical protein
MEDSLLALGGFGEWERLAVTDDSTIHPTLTCTPPSLTYSESRSLVNRPRFWERDTRGHSDAQMEIKIREKGHHIILEYSRSKGSIAMNELRVYICYNIAITHDLPARDDPHYKLYIDCPLRYPSYICPMHPGLPLSQLDPCIPYPYSSVWFIRS